MDSDDRDFHLVATPKPIAMPPAPGRPDPGANPFKVVIDPEMRAKLRRALFELIDFHDEALAEHFAEGKLSLESYKEYIELFARSLKETMDSREGVAYLLRAAGFEVPAHDINLDPELRWKRGPGAFGRTLL
ncbi:MAG: hypothetical protein ACJ8KU_04185 [Chthoniobacterales bacterium]